MFVLLLLFVLVALLVMHKCYHTSRNDPSLMRPCVRRSQEALCGPRVPHHGGRPVPRCGLLPLGG